MFIINIVNALPYMYSPSLALSRHHRERRELREEYSVQRLSLQGCHLSLHYCVHCDFACEIQKLTVTLLQSGKLGFSLKNIHIDSFHFHIFLLIASVRADLSADSCFTFKTCFCKTDLHQTNFNHELFGFPLALMEAGWYGR